MSTGQYRNTATRDRHRNAIRTKREPCALCGKPIDYTIRWPDSMCFVVDHITARTRGGPDTIDNKQPAHKVCNERKGALDAIPDRADTITTTRTWWTQGQVPPPHSPAHPAA